jgi:hypothetical protein
MPRVEGRAHDLAAVAVEPLVRDHAVLGRVGAGDENGVAARGERVAGAVVGIREVETVVGEPAKAIRAEAIAVARQHVAPQLIDRDLQHEARRRRGDVRALGGGSENGDGEHRPQDGQGSRGHAAPDCPTDRCRKSFAAASLHVQHVHHAAIAVGRDQVANFGSGAEGPNDYTSHLFRCRDGSRALLARGPI